MTTTTWNTTTLNLLDNVRALSLTTLANVTCDGDETVTGTLAVTGNATFNANVTVDGGTTLDGILTVTGATTLPGTTTDNLTVNGSIDSATTQYTVTGTTAGSAVWSQPFQGASYKKVIIVLLGYENTTATAQTVTYTTAFTETPSVVNNGTGLTIAQSTATKTTFSLPDSMTAVASGTISIEGY